MDNKPWKKNNLLLKFYESDNKDYLDSVDKLYGDLLTESSAFQWSDLKAKYQGVSDAVIEHLIKLFYFRDFDIYRRGWINTCCKYFEKVPILKSTHKPPRKEQIYNCLWSDGEDTFDKYHTTLVNDFNETLVDLPEIKHPEVEKSHDFCQEYMMWVSLNLSKGKSITTIMTYSVINDLWKKYPYYN